MKVGFSHESFSGYDRENVVRCRISTTLRDEQGARMKSIEIRKASAHSRHRSFIRLHHQNLDPHSYAIMSFHVDGGSALASAGAKFKLAFKMIIKPSKTFTKRRKSTSKISSVSSVDFRFPGSVWGYLMVNRENLVFTVFP
jgi:hypothetical protein